jgi:hypothetical protein
MQTLVIYDSKFGNTEKIADAIGRGIGSVSDVRVTSTFEAKEALEALASRPDLVFVGGPTQNHGPSAGLRQFVKRGPGARQDRRPEAERHDECAITAQGRMAHPRHLEVSTWRRSRSRNQGPLQRSVQPEPSVRGSPLIGGSTLAFSPMREYSSHSTGIELRADANEHCD